MTKRLFILTFLTLFSLGTLSAWAEPAVRVMVSILPQAAFVEQIGGERVEVGVLVRPGQSPHTYQPTPAQMAELAKARIYFRIGVTFERELMPRIESSIPGLEVVDLRQGIALRPMEEAHAHDHSHGDSHAHDHKHEPGEPDPHVWLDPLLVKVMSATIRDALVKADPDGAAHYEARHAAWVAELDRVHQTLSETLAPLKGSKVYVFHAAYGYFTDRYGLKQEPVEVGGKSPSPRQISRIVNMARQDGVRVIFVQPQFDQRAARAIAESIGGSVLALDPLARDYIANLEGMAQTIRKELKSFGD